MNKDATAPEAPPSYQETMGQQPYPNASAGAGKIPKQLFAFSVQLPWQRKKAQN